MRKKSESETMEMTPENWLHDIFGVLEEISDTLTDIRQALHRIEDKQ